MPTAKTPVTRRDVCAGGVVYRTVAAGVEIAVADESDRLTGAPNTRLAKGHVDTGETPEQAALREVREEIGIVARIVAPLGSVEYTFLERDTRIEKEVHFYLMQPTSDAFHDLDGEMDRMYWLPIEEAARRLTFDTEQRIVERAQAALRGRAAD